MSNASLHVRKTKASDASKLRPLIIINAAVNIRWQAFDNYWRRVSLFTPIGGISMDHMNRSRQFLKRVMLWLCFSSFGTSSFCPLLQGGEYGVKVWGVDEGLPQSSVTAIAQTPDGFLWVGTFLSGVSRFDGVKFVNYNSANTPALNNPGVRRLLVDSEGHLWLNDQANQLFLRQGDTFIKVGDNMKIFNLVGSRLPGRVTFATQTGEIIVGTRKKNGSWKWERHQPAGINYTVKYLEDADGVIWYQLANGTIEVILADG